MVLKMIITWCLQSRRRRANSMMTCTVHDTAFLIQKSLTSCLVLAFAWYNFAFPEPLFPSTKQYKRYCSSMLELLGRVVCHEQPIVALWLWAGWKLGGVKETYLFPQDQVVWIEFGKESCLSRLWLLRRGRSGQACSHEQSSPFARGFFWGGEGVPSTLPSRAHQWQC